MRSLIPPLISKNGAINLYVFDTLLEEEWRALLQHYCSSS